MGRSDLIPQVIDYMEASFAYWVIFDLICTTSEKGHLKADTLSFQPVRLKLNHPSGLRDELGRDREQRGSN